MLKSFIPKESTDTPKKDLTGKTFYNILLLEFVGRTKKGEAAYKCLCHCGKQFVTTGISVENNFTASCGCFHKHSRQKLPSSDISTKPLDIPNATWIPLTKDKWALIDTNDIEKLKDLRFVYTKHGYASSNKVFLHNIILPHPTLLVDHINRDKLDNRKGNLRLVTPNENSANRRIHRNNKTGTRGVHQHKNGKWIAEIGHERKLIYLGRFDTKEEAVQKRLEAEKIYYKVDKL